MSIKPKIADKQLLAAIQHENGTFSFVTRAKPDEAASQPIECRKLYTRKEKRDAVRVQEKASNKDRLWFATHRDRTIYIRHALKGELQAMAVFGSAEWEEIHYAQNLHHIIVEQIAPGVRYRLPLVTAANVTDAGEGESYCVKQIAEECLATRTDLSLEQFAQQIEIRLSVLNQVGERLH